MRSDRDDMGAGTNSYCALCGAPHRPRQTGLKCRGHRIGPGDGELAHKKRKRQIRNGKQNRPITQNRIPKGNLSHNLSDIGAPCSGGLSNKQKGQGRAAWMGSTKNQLRVVGG